MENTEKTRPNQKYGKNEFGIWCVNPIDNRLCDSEDYH